jgi:hypothetical protein
MTRLPVVALGTFVLAVPAWAADVPPQTEVINKYIAQGWEKAGIKKPAVKATDLEFCRRVFIDLIGRIPTYEEAVDFEQDKSSNKRAKLVARLLNESAYQPKVNGQPVKNDDKKTLTIDYTDAYATNWANTWGVWLMSRTAHPIYRESLEFWLEKQFLNNTSYKDMVVELLTAKGVSHKGDQAKSQSANGATNFVMFHLGDTVPGEKQSQLGKFDAVPITSRVTRLFLGLQTQCTQCHDHPENKEWVQTDFWGVNAFFRQTVRSANPTPSTDRRNMANPTNPVLSDVDTLNGDGVVFFERRDGKVMAANPEFLKDLAQAERGEIKSGKYIPEGTKGTRREQLAQFVVKHDNFARAYVNRIWGHLFGRGLNKEPAVDNFGSNNEVIHPELLDALAKDFAAYEYDPKKLLTWICLSDAYNLSHVAPKELADPKYDAYFARMPLKALSPEVLFESLQTATRFDDTAPTAGRRNLKADWTQKLVRAFGDDEGNEVTFNGTMIQALMMMNGPELNGQVAKGDATSVVRRAVMRHRSPDAILDELFMTTLCRHPTPTELDKIKATAKGGLVMESKPATEKPKPAEKPKTGEKEKPATEKPKSGEKVAEKEKEKPKTSPPPAKKPTPVAGFGPANDVVAFYQDVYWALLNTAEFMLNH